MHLLLGMRTQKSSRRSGEQLDRFAHTFFGTAPYESYVALAERLNALAPIYSDDVKSFLITTGAEAVENSVKIARHYTRRRGIVVFNGSFHGRTLVNPWNDR